MPRMARKTSSCLILLILLLTITVPSVKGSRFFTSDFDQISETTVSDLKTTAAGVSCECEATYGFLPCTNTLWGMLFMIIVYEVLLSFGERYITAGSNLFFETFGTGFFGASIFHLLGTVPQVGLILISGLSASPDSMGEELEVSMGLLAGTTIISLTLIWGAVVAFGNHDLSHPPNNSSLEHHSKPFTLTGYGITTDIETNVTARLILVSLIPFIILQLSKVHNSSFWIRLIILVSFIVSVVFLSLYCIYQMFEPWMQNRRLEFVLRKYMRQSLVQSLLTTGSRPNIPVIKEIFHRIDENGNSYISTAELKSLILGIQIEHSGLDEQDFVTKVLKEFDSSGDSQINEEEFINGLSNWLISANKDSFKLVSQAKQKFINIFSENSPIEEEESLLEAPKRTTTTKAPEKVWLKYIKAALFILFGASITLFLAEPLMITVQEFCTAANIPSFMGSYVMIPLALTFGQALSAISSAKHRTENAISLALSEIYNGVFLNNMMGLIIVLGLVYCRNLSWDVSTNVLVLLIICAIMGLYTTFCSKFPVWTSILAFALYPLSLLSIYFVTSILGWS